MVISKKQVYHLEANRGLINDPNGLTYFKGQYYVFFQWNRLENNHSYKEWGLFTSKNMVDWKFKETAILPSDYFDKDGVYSGSGYVINHQLYLFYTGNSKVMGKRKSYQCLAISKDGVQFTKRGPILNTPIEYTEHFRDPKVLKINDNLYYMLIGAQLKSGKGAIALALSNDARNWEYKHSLAYSNDYQMIECPDLFKLNNQCILLYGMQERDNTKDQVISSFSCFKIVDFDVGTGKIRDIYLDSHYQLMDYGFDFYAPQTFEDNKNRRIMYAWMSRMDDTQEEKFKENEPNIHCLTLPRELFIKDDQLYQKPVKEVYQILGKEISKGIEKDKIVCTPRDRSFYTRLIIKNATCKISLYNQEVEMNYDHIKQEFVLYRINWINKKREMKECHIEYLDHIETWSDQSSLEIFINEGQIVLSSRIFPLGVNHRVEIEGVENNHILIKEIEGDKYE